MAFVNPYTFIRFPRRVCREAPLGHAPTRNQATERYTGSLTVDWQIQTPLAIPHDGSWGLGGEDEPGTPVSGEIRIPGASVKGAVRSLHEALFAGCARILDSNFTPVYREAVTTKLLDGWQLAVVMTPDARVTRQMGQDPLIKVMLCSTPVGWVRGDAIKRVAQDLPRTGDFVIPTDPIMDGRPNGFRGVARHVASERGRDWIVSFKRAICDGLSVMLVTDTKARNNKHPYYWAAAKPEPARGLMQVSTTALASLRQKLRGADKINEPDETTPRFESVVWPPRDGLPVAQRRTVDGYLRQGDVIWVKVRDNQVTDIKLSLAWRRPATGDHATMASRVPPQVKPCRDLADGLCLSCMIFGSIDAQATDERVGAQNGYAGHIRFGDVTGTCTAGRSTVSLAPLGEPHPGAGMFYLTPIRSQEMAKTMRANDFPTQWDSQAGESKGPRELRGRKFYWHSDPSEQKQRHNLPRERYLAQPGVHTNTDLLPRIHLVDSAELTQTITFDGLDAAALASLLATLNPELLFGDGAYALHLGRGKPLGLGSVRTRVALEMTTTADRYAPNPAKLVELADLRTILTEALPKRCGELTAIHTEARTVLSVHGLGPRAADVSYPTIKDWTQFGREEFHQSYAYFQANSGQVKRRGTQSHREPWSPLPDVLDEGK